MAPAEDKAAPSSNQTGTASIQAEGSKPSSGSSAEYQLRQYLLLLATLVATVTYVAGLNLPGGAWSADTPDGRRAGDPILRVAHYSRYLTFYYCNATSFAASLVVSLLLLVLDVSNTGWLLALLRLVMVLDLLGLMGAYAAGSCRDLFTTVYSALLVCAIFAYVVAAFGTHLIPWVLAMLPRKKQRSENNAEKPGEVAGTHDEGEELHEVLMLLATFAVTITYGAGLSPPGGFWADSKDGHRVSDPVLQDHHPGRYRAFFVCNTTAFVASLFIIILLVEKKLRGGGFAGRLVAQGLINTVLFGLMGAYAAGSCREADDTTYVVSLIGAVLASIFLQVAVTEAIKRKKSCCCFRVLATMCSFASECLQNIRNFFAGSQDQTTGSTQHEEAVEKTRSLVLLLATLAVSITYQAGLDPPGGLWPQDGDGHRNGDPILLTANPTRYKVFFYSNSAAFVASLIVIIMVQCRFLLMAHTLEAAMILDLFGLISAYAAGSCRDTSTSIYVVALAGAVLVYVVIHIIFSTLDDQDEQRDADKLEKRREVLLFLAILAATLTYQAGLTPPGGFWSADENGHRAGFPVLLDNYPRQYEAFFYCNAVSFMASVTLIVLLVNPNLYRPGIRCYALYVCMVVGMFGLMGAYAAGSSRNLRTSIYVLTLVIAVFAFVTLEVVYFLIYPILIYPILSKYLPNQKPENQEGEPQGNISDAQNKPSGSRDKHMSEYLMLLGVLAASVTYQAGLKPPGGLWQEDGNGHSAGNSILHDINKRRYLAFLYSNSTSFMASIVVIFLLLPWTPRKHNLPLWSIHTAILLDMLGLLGAYAAGSTRDWETSRNVIYLAIPVLAYLAAYVAVSVLRKTNPCHKRKTDEHRSSGKDEENQK